MALIRNVLILAVLCVLAGALTQASEEGQHNNGDLSSVTQEKCQEHNHEHSHEHNHEHNHEHVHEHNHEYNRNNKHDHDHEHNSERTWVSCDFTINPKKRCHDCDTRLICKPIGGLLLDCPSSFAPYCNNGLCSPVPSMECA